MNEKLKEKRILCSARAHLPQDWFGEAHGVGMSSEAFFAAMEGVPLCWIGREEAETDPYYKQLIPYVVVQSADGSRIAGYRRKGAEARLHDLWSIGIGGHVDAEDLKGSEWDWRRVIERGLRRELAEELGLEAPKGPLSFLGVINEERTDVGRVHLGLVYRLMLEASDRIRVDDELNAFTWLEKGDLQGRRFELWSELALQLLPDRLR